MHQSLWQAAQRPVPLEYRSLGCECGELQLMPASAPLRCGACLQHSHVHGCAQQACCEVQASWLSWPDAVRCIN